MTNKIKPSLLTMSDDDVNNCFVDHENKRIYLNEDDSPDLVILFDKLFKDGVWSGLSIILVKSVLFVV